jgi:hypothetical protein
MNKLTVFGHILKLNGHTRTITLAERHNKRLISQEIGEYGVIDSKKTPDNVELIPINGDSLEEVVKQHIIAKGIDINHHLLRKKNRGYAVEFIFTVTAGFKCDFNSMYSDCLELLRTYLPDCPIVHAVIHHDEDTPHMHVIVVPFVNNKLQADRVCGYKGVSTKRNKFFFESLNKRYGLTFPVYLKKAEKKIGAELAIRGYQNTLDSSLRMILDIAIIQAIYGRPEPFLHALNITYDDILAAMKSTPT